MHYYRHQENGVVGSSLNTCSKNRAHETICIVYKQNITRNVNYLAKMIYSMVLRV